MLIAPKYLKKFKCLAGACPESCCKQGWEIALDTDTVRHYKACGVLDIEEHLKIGADGDTVLKLKENGVCPYLNKDGLCDLYIASNGVLGEICREYPRFYEEYDGFTETGISVSCPEALRLVFNATEEDYTLTDAKTDDNLLNFLILARKTAFSVIFNEKTAENATKKLLYLGYLLQEAIDFGESEANTLPKANELNQADFEYQTAELKEILLQCEILNPRWQELLKSPEVQATEATEQEKKSYLAYLCYRYFLKGINTEDELQVINAIIGAFRLTTALPCNLKTATTLFAKEIEHNPENIQKWFSLYETEI